MGHKTEQELLVEIHARVTPKPLTLEERLELSFWYVLVTLFALASVAGVAAWASRMVSWAGLWARCQEVDWMVGTALGVFGTATGIWARTVDDRLPWRITPLGCLSLALIGAAWSTSLISEVRGAAERKAKEDELRETVGETLAQAEALKSTLDAVASALVDLQGDLTGASQDLKVVSDATVAAIDAKYGARLALLNDRRLPPRQARVDELAAGLAAERPLALGAFRADLQSDAVWLGKLAAEVKVPTADAIARQVVVPTPVVPTAVEIANQLRPSLPTADEIAARVACPDVPAGATPPPEL